MPDIVWFIVIFAPIIAFALFGAWHAGLFIADRMRARRLHEELADYDRREDRTMSLAEWRRLCQESQARSDVRRHPIRAGGGFRS